MLDQAARLREIATELQADRNDYLMPDSRKRARAQVFAVTSGKGGVGKSNIAVNLAIKVQEAGYKVLLIDANINLANTDILMGHSPYRTLADAIIKDYHIREVIYTGPCDLHILAGGSGFVELTDLPDAKQARIIRQLESLEFKYDYLILDTPAGLNKQILSYVTYASHAIVVVTPEPTSIADAYAMVKVLTLQQSSVRLHVLINQVNSLEHARDIFSKFKLVVDRFLKIRIGYLGYIVKDKNVSRAVLKQKPLVMEFPKSPAALCINNVADQIVSRGNTKIEIQHGSFFQRLAKISIFH